MDLYTIPIRTIARPVKISPTLNEVVTTFTLQQQDVDLLRKYPNSRLEMRGIRQAKESFKNSWPNFSRFSISPGPLKKVFELPEREQSRKRKDFPID